MHIFALTHFCTTGRFVGMIKTPVEIERRRRIKLSIWAYAYEFHDHSIVPDAMFDVESYCVDLSIDTDRPDLDFWFRANFNPCTGQWIHNHPDLVRIGQLYKEFYT